MDRRTFLRNGMVATGAVAFSGSLWQAASAAPAQNGTGPYGALKTANGNGIMLPAGFTSRVVARSRQPVAGYVWHDAPDGGQCFTNGTGWIYVSNSEIQTTGGASAIRFSSTGAIQGAYRILGNTNRNCAGGSTPWRTWLSCEEIDNGYVFEADPFGVKAAVRRPAMGRFNHEAAAADPVRRVVYLTEDKPDGCLYRFVPSTWTNLSAGTLQVLMAGTATTGSFGWATVPDPSAASTPTRNQVPGAKRFNGGEGCYYSSGTLRFTTKGDSRVWRLNLGAATYQLDYDDNLVTGGGAPLTGVDNLTGSRSGDLYVAEDGGNMEINIITPDAVVAPFLRIAGQASSEITGPAFSPDGTRLYFSSQRGTTNAVTGGITYEVRGPFRTAA